MFDSESESNLKMPMKLIAKQTNETQEVPQEICNLAKMLGGEVPHTVNKFEWHLMLSDQEITELCVDLLPDDLVRKTGLPKLVILALLKRLDNSNYHATHDLKAQILKSYPIIAMYLEQTDQIERNNEREAKHND